MDCVLVGKEPMIRIFFKKYVIREKAIRINRHVKSVVLTEDGLRLCSDPSSP